MTQSSFTPAELLASAISLLGAKEVRANPDEAFKRVHELLARAAVANERAETVNAYMQAWLEDWHNQAMMDEEKKEMIPMSEVQRRLGYARREDAKKLVLEFIRNSKGTLSEGNGIDPEEVLRKWQMMKPASVKEDCVPAHYLPLIERYRIVRTSRGRAKGGQNRVKRRSKKS